MSKAVKTFQNTYSCFSKETLVPPRWEIDQQELDLSTEALTISILPPREEFALSKAFMLGP